MSYTEMPGNVTAPQGFKVAAGHCGVKEGDVPDLVLIVSDAPAATAATLTTNQFRAAPTYVTERAVSNGCAQVIVANSGNANCATGAEGMENAIRMGRKAAAVTGVSPADVIVCSTGGIGHQLPIETIEAGIETLAGHLGETDADTVARSIMTTDTYQKAISIELDLDGTDVRIGGICKGAGMIHPNMATMLAFFTTDVAITPELLGQALRDAVQVSFNCISVDGDQSTNDTCAILANGAAEMDIIEEEDDPRFAAFADALTYCCMEQAKKIAWDGEGATKKVTITVTGAELWEDAHTVGRHLANYTLLKVAYFAGDFNWGRIAAGMGAAGVYIDPDLVTIHFCGTKVFEAGEPVAHDVVAGRELLGEEHIDVTVDLGMGGESCTVWTCDLTPGYIEFNAVDEL